MTGCSTGFIQSVSSCGSSCVCLSLYRDRIPANLLYQQWSAAFIHPTVCLSYHNSANLAKSSSASAFDASASSELDFNPLGENKTEAETGYYSENHWYSKIGDLSGSWLCGGFVLVTAGFTKDYMHSSGRKREDGSEGACSLLFLLCFVCVWVGMESSLLTHRLPYESGSKLTAWWLDLISSHRISDSNLFLLREIRDARPFSIYVTMTMQYECVILKGLRSVLSSNTVHLLSQQYTEIFVSLVFDWAETSALGVTTQTKVCLQSADLSQRLALSVCRSVFCACYCFVSCAQRWVGKLWAYSALCSSLIDETNSHRNPFPRIITPALYLPPSHFHYCFYLILQPTSPPDHHPSSHFKKLLVFIEA